MLINFHDHLAFYEGFDQAINMIEDSEIVTLACAMDLEDYIKIEKYSEKKPLIKKGFGIHPFKIKGDTSTVGFEKYIEKADFIGEIGMDFFWNEEKEYYGKQREVFEYFVEMAVKYDKITNIHTKGAEREVLDILQKHRPRNPIVHWYSGDLALVEEYLELGSYFTISVDVRISSLTDDLIKMLPMDRILTETDGPTSLKWVKEENGNPEGIPDYGYPEYIGKIVNYIAELKNLDSEYVENRIYQNYLHLFGE